MFPTNVPQLPGNGVVVEPGRMNREARKVQITGKSTHFVSLPKRWVDASRIRGGDLIYLVPQADGRLVIEPLGLRPLRDEAPMRLWLSESSPDWVLRQISSAYVAGWSRIELPNGLPGRLDPAVLRAAFLGVDVTAEADGLLVIKVSIGTNRAEPLAGIRRLRSIVRWRLAHVLQAEVPAGDVDVAAPSADDSRRLAWFLLRQSTELQHDAVQARHLGLQPGEAACLQRAVRALLRIDETTALLQAGPRGARSGESAVRLVELLGTVMKGFVAKPERPDPAPWRLVAAARRQVTDAARNDPLALLGEVVVEGCAEILAASEERYYSSAGTD